MKKITITILALMMALLLFACGSNEKNTLNIGTSEFSIILPEGYKNTEDNYSEDQIAYYYKDDNSIDFDVYQWAKDGKYTLESEAQYYASLFNTEPEVVVINGIKCFKYISDEEYKGATYTVVNYMFENETDLFELCFWTIDTAEEYAAVDAIINTLKKN